MAQNDAFSHCTCIVHVSSQSRHYRRHQFGLPWEMSLPLKPHKRRLSASHSAPPCVTQKSICSLKLHTTTWYYLYLLVNHSKWTNFSGQLHLEQAHSFPFFVAAKNVCSRLWVLGLIGHLSFGKPLVTGVPSGHTRVCNGRASVAVNNPFGAFVKIEKSARCKSP